MTRHLSDELRDSTRAAHGRLETLTFASALASGTITLASYVGYLRAMAVVHGVVEHELPIETDQRIDAVWNDEMRRLPALQRDLAYFADRAIGDIPAAQRAAQEVANRLLGRSVQMPLSMLGYLYVLEGSILGASVLGPQAARAFGLERADGRAYLSHDPSASEGRWRQFRARLDGLELTDPEREAIGAAALEAYAGIEAILRALHPVDAEALVRKVASINPEAGTHPISQDPLELEAARHAGDRCLRAFPYFIWRYGERGRRFTDSDGAWLVTLVRYPQARIERQVAWLGHVLATRGMPRILLQRHLELLYEELRLRMPEPQAAYERLLVAADGMANTRRARLSDEELDRLTDRFERAVGSDWRSRLPGAALIIVGAVVDEDAGLVGTLDSVRSWFTDETRFPVNFIRAVNALENEARACVGSSSVSAA